MLELSDWESMSEQQRKEKITNYVEELNTYVAALGSNNPPDQYPQRDRNFSAICSSFSASRSGTVWNQRWGIFHRSESGKTVSEHSGMEPADGTDVPHTWCG